MFEWIVFARLLVLGFVLSLGLALAVMRVDWKVSFESSFPLYLLAASMAFFAWLMGWLG